MEGSENLIVKTCQSTQPLLDLQFHVDDRTAQACSLSEASGVRVIPLTGERCFWWKPMAILTTLGVQNFLFVPQKCPAEYFSRPMLNEVGWYKVLLDSPAGSPWRGVILKNRHIYHVMSVYEVLLQGIPVFLESTFNKLRFC